ncbi:hypothetical protein NLU13_2181 [Sarocladium strictum]|uniref:Uncharacterized protein n=1 Tax=Sarocladium strictum TaxID=5046 RepID=A0AA39LCG1_SARSR|nr:hypothetical protein NLU13_2181 [Sarocladium strictum]
MASAPKIIVLGSLNGQLETPLKKLATLQAKNNFALAILVGDVFSASTDDATIDSLLNGAIEVPLPTYFTVGTHPLPPRIAEKVEANEEVCPNLHFLGKRSVTKLSEGLRIVTLGGQLDPKLIAGQSQEQHLPFHTTDDIKSLKGANTADILLTSTWPQGVWNGSQVALEPAQQASLVASQEVAELCTALKPRYHFSASPGAFFYEREPFMHVAGEDTNANTVTRFISMAPYGNEAKKKAMYAFSLNKTDTTIPTGATVTPFASKKRPHQPDEGYSRYGNGHRGDAHRSRRRRHRSPPPGPDRCYFCLSRADLSVHMICSIGNEAYVTTAKGPLATPSTFSSQGLKFPGQLIIIPIPHAPTFAHIRNEDSTENDPHRTYAEMTRFRESIQAMIASQSSHKLGAITYEISRERNIHLIWQLHAFPASQIRDGIAEAAFRVEAENSGYPAFTTRDITLEDQLSAGGDFFRVWLWADDGEDKIKGKTLVMPLPAEQRFDIQFGRRVVAKLLGLEDRMVWQDCEQTVEEEEKDVAAFKEAYEEWDFTNE